MSLKEFNKWDSTLNENLWIDMQNISLAESQKVLEDIFHFHPLAIEDTSKHITDHTVHYPKIDDFDKYLFIVFNGLRQEDKSF